ncbi:hypothetical protein GQ53DRAFT_455993 [Thozetella sp. PMI_491]|nr:hypothetical protein GQ53DRAFT_455993 [Thozetella sp. PMI_491]
MYPSAGRRRAGARQLSASARNVFKCPSMSPSPLAKYAPANAAIGESSLDLASPIGSNTWQAGHRCRPSEVPLHLTTRRYMLLSTMSVHWRAGMQDASAAGYPQSGFPCFLAYSIWATGARTAGSQKYRALPCNTHALRREGSRWRGGGDACRVWYGYVPILKPLGKTGKTLFDAVSPETLGG